MTRARIVIDEGRSLHGVAMGNTLDIRFPEAETLWQFCGNLLEMKFSLSTYRARRAALLESVVGAVNRGEALT